MTISPEMKVQMELSVGIANRVYEILEKKGMSQKDFAKILGKTETEVSRWLSGTHNLTLATIAKMSVALEESIISPASLTSGYKTRTSRPLQYLSESGVSDCDGE